VPLWCLKVRAYGILLREHAPKRQKPASKLVKDGYIQKELKICKYVLTHPPECDKIGAIFCGQMLIKII
tara:strand:+ start:179 stop:385 length:207 start_codon:yes stop_codon:yes gene_type:complete